MSGIIGSKLNIRGSGLVGSLGTDGQHLLSSGAGKTNVFETSAAGTAGAPYFQARMSSAYQALSDNTGAKIAFNTTTYDSGSTYDTTNYRWTPGEEGFYWISASVMGSADSDSEMQSTFFTFVLNGAIIHYCAQADNRTAGYGRGHANTGAAIVEMDDDDYIEAFMTLNTVSGGAARVNGENTQSWFSGFKIA